MAHDKKRRRGKKRKRTSEKIAEAIRRMRNPIESLIEDMGQELASVVDFYKLASEKIRGRIRSIAGGLTEHLSKGYKGVAAECEALAILSDKVRKALYKARELSQQLIGKVREYRLDNVSEMSVREEMRKTVDALASEKEKVDSSDVKLKPVSREEDVKETTELTRSALVASDRKIVDKEEVGGFKKESIFVRGVRRYSTPIFRAAQVATLLSGFFYTPIHNMVELWPSHFDQPTITKPFVDENFKFAKEMEKGLKSINESASKVKKGVPEGWRDKWMILVPMERTIEGTEVRKDYELDDQPCVLTLGRTVYITYA